MTNAHLAVHISLIARIAAQYSHELAYGMWNPDFCSADNDMARDRFVQEIDHRLDELRTTKLASQNTHKGE